MTDHSHDHTHVHETHSEIVKRLRRANGHLEKVVTMIEGGRPCTEVAQQLQAVSKAIIKAKAVFIHDHINGCLSEANLKTPDEQQKAIADFQEITKYLA